MFSKKLAQPRSTITGDGMVTTSRGGAASFSVLAADLSIKGDLVANADLHIDGKIEGDVDCTSLVQGETSAIHGMVRAKNARLSGTVHGTIDVGELVILKSARIEGDVSYDALTIEQGAQVNGRFTHRIEDAAARLTLAS